MMTKTLSGFCRHLLDDDPCRQALDPERVAAAFVDYFGLSARPTLEELNALAQRAGFGEVREEPMDGLKGAHVGQPGGEYHIYHREDLWEGAKAQTVLHELYEIVLENMPETDSSGPWDRSVCPQADRFAAAALMQPDIFLPYARASGLDVAVLHDHFGCAYASAALRLAEVLRDQPLMVVLYEREERGDPVGWTEPPVLWAKVVKRTAGFRPRRSRLLGGWRGGMPNQRRPVPVGSLAEEAAHGGEPEYAEGDGIAAIATPVHWKGHLAKVIVVAVPWEDRRVLEPQLGKQASQSYRRNHARVVTAVP